MRAHILHICVDGGVPRRSPGPFWTRMSPGNHTLELSKSIIHPVARRTLAAHTRACGRVTAGQLTARGPPDATARRTTACGHGRPAPACSSAPGPGSAPPPPSSFGAGHARAGSAAAPSRASAAPPPPLPWRERRLSGGQSCPFRAIDRAVRVGELERVLSADLGESNLGGSRRISADLGGSRRISRRLSGRARTSRRRSTALPCGGSAARAATGRRGAAATPGRVRGTHGLIPHPSRRPGGEASGGGRGGGRRQEGRGSNREGNWQGKGEGEATGARNNSQAACYRCASKPRLRPLSAKSRQNLGKISAASRLPLGCLSAASRLPLGCLSAASRLPLGCLSAASRLHLGRDACGRSPNKIGERREKAISMRTGASCARPERIGCPPPPEPPLQRTSQARHTVCGVRQLALAARGGGEGEMEAVWGRRQRRR